MKKLAVIAKGVCVNGLVCSAAAILLTACGAGMPDATKSQPSKFAGVMQVSAAVAAEGQDAEPGPAGAAAEQAGGAAATAAADQVAASGLPTPPASDQGAVAGASGAQLAAGAAPAAATGDVPPAPADAQQASVAGAPAAGPAAAQGADSFALVGYGATPGNRPAPATEGPVWPDPQDSASAAIQR